MLQLRSGVELNGRYVVHGEVATGGYATVWRASDKDLNRTVALKRLLKRGISGSSEDVAVLRAEAQKSAQLVHPNIVQVYDIIEVDGEHLIVMEYIDGQSLASFLRERALAGESVPLDIAIAITRETLAGVDFAHGRSICHRDLSPGNVLLTSGGTPKIGDFGIAKVVSGQDGDSGVSAPLQGGTGNAHYMSPEQARGEPADFASDLFMVGILSYLLLTGKHPFAHPSGLFEIPELLVRDDYLPDPPKPTGSLVATQQRIFREFGAVVMRLLQRERASRFASARAAIDAIEAITPTIDCPQCGERNAEHHRFCAYCGAGLQVAPPPERPITSGHESAEDLVNEGYQLTQQKQWDAAIRYYLRAIVVDPHSSRAYRNLSFALNRAGRYEEAVQAADEGLALDGLMPEHRASMLYERAFANQNMRRYDDAYEGIQAALKVSPRSPKLLYFRARLQEFRANFEEAKSDARAVLRLVPDHAGALRLLGEYAESS